MTGAGVIPLRVGMKFGAITDLIGVPDSAIVIDNTEAPWTVQELFYSWEDKDERLFPMHLIYIPRDWTGPVAGPEVDAAGTESDAGVSVPDDSEPTMGGYWAAIARADARAASMANHPAGKGRGSLYLGESGAAL